MRSTRLLFATAFALIAPNATVDAQTAYVFGSTSGSFAISLLINGTTTVQASNRGWYGADGSNSSGNGNYIAGQQFGAAWRNYMVFDLSNFSPLASSAVLRIDNPSNGYLAPASWSLSYDLFDVTGFATLGSVTGVSIFNDLGSGVGYGGVTLTSASNGTTVQIALNAAALNSMNTQREDGLWGLGGTASRAVITVTPEPSTYVLMGVGLLAMGLVQRNRKRAN